MNRLQRQTGKQVSLLASRAWSIASALFAGSGLKVAAGHEQADCVGCEAGHLGRTIFELREGGDYTCHSRPLQPRCLHAPAGGA